MNVVELLDELRRYGVTLEADGERLRYAPKTAVSAALAERMRTHKRELLAILAKPLDLPKTAEADINETALAEQFSHEEPWGRDGWPTDTVPPPPACARCGSLDAWQPIAAGTLVGDPRHGKPEGPKWRCSRCDPSKHSERIRRLAARSMIRTRAA